jgi:hypothetical protein
MELLTSPRGFSLRKRKSSNPGKGYVENVKKNIKLQSFVGEMKNEPHGHIYLINRDIYFSLDIPSHIS